MVTDHNMSMSYVKDTRYLNSLIVRAYGVRSLLGSDDDTPQCVGHFGDVLKAADQLADFVPDSAKEN